MRYLTLIIIFSSLFQISNCFAQTKEYSSNTSSGLVIKRILPYESGLVNNHISSKVQDSSIISNETDDVEYEYEQEYEYEFQVPKNQSSAVSDTAEYEYEMTANQVSSISNNVYEEFEYEYETPVNHSRTIYNNDSNVEYDYE